LIENLAVGNQQRSCSEIGDSQQGLEAVNIEVEGSTVLEAITRQPGNMQQTGNA
jgi:hypothetical protein